MLSSLPSEPTQALLFPLHPLVSLILDYWSDFAPTEKAVLRKNYGPSPLGCFICLQQCYQETQIPG